MKTLTALSVLVMLAASKGTVQALSTAPTTAAAGALAIVKNAKVPGLRNGMDYCKLGDSDLVVSKVCMGTMTFGEQNEREEGVEHLNRAFDEYGVNFIDTAEMYPVPTKPDTQGQTDQAVGMFLKNRKREDVILATKVSGRSDQVTWMPGRSKGTEVTEDQIVKSVDASLQRLGTDYVDLLQIHWPDRYSGGAFGGADFMPSLYEERSAPNSFDAQLKGLQKVVKSGKVRYVGLSNETPYGVASFVHLARQFPDLYPRVVSIQNSYSLVNRKDFEAGLGEACYHYRIGLLPYSPLAGGTLSGKYRAKDKDTSKYRLNMFPGFMERYLGSHNEAAVNEYCDIADRHNLTPTQLALAWCYHREHVTSTIIGATSLPQLDENIQAYDIRLSDKMLKDIEDVYKIYTDPTKMRSQ